MYPAVSNLKYFSKSLRKIPDVNLNAKTPIIAPNIIRIYWSLIATAVVILSIEKAKSVKESKATIFKKLKFLFVLSFCDSRFSDSFGKKTFEINK